MRGNWCRAFVAGCPSCRQPHPLHFILSSTTNILLRDGTSLPFVSALRCQLQFNKQIHFWPLFQNYLDKIHRTNCHHYELIYWFTHFPSLLLFSTLNSKGNFSLNPSHHRPSPLPSDCLYGHRTAQLFSF